MYLKQMEVFAPFDAGCLFLHRAPLCTRLCSFRVFPFSFNPVQGLSCFLYCPGARNLSMATPTNCPPTPGCILLILMV